MCGGVGLSMPLTTTYASAALIAIFSLFVAILHFFIRPYGVSIRGIGWLHFQNVSVKKGEEYTLSATRLEFIPQFPTPSRPTWGTLIVHQYERKDPDQHITISRIICTLHFFPILLPQLFSSSRPTNGPLVTARLEDFRVLVHTSARWPNWIAELRDHLMYVILSTEILRLDHLRTRGVGSTVRAAGVRSTKGELRKAGPAVDSDESGDDSEGEASEEDKDGAEADGRSSDFGGRQSGHGYQAPKEVLAEDEAVLSVTSSGWEIHNIYNHRMYSFGGIDAELRRSWNTKRGALVLLATDCSWKKLPKLRVPLSNKLLSYLSCLFDPWSLVDLELDRVDVSFDHFKLRHAKLPDQVGIALMTRMNRSDVSPGDVGEMIWDAVAQCILSVHAADVLC